MSAERGKQAAGEAAVERVASGMRLGLGTGSTVAFFLEELARRDLDVAGLATSEDTTRRCRELGIRLLDPEDATHLDLAVDGADELTRDLVLTKGGGGALLREKVVASLADHMVVVATSGKLVDRLAASFPLPVEVVPFALPSVRDRLTAWGFEVTARSQGDYRTDNGNGILDAHLPAGIEDPAGMEQRLTLVPGVVACGLFVGLAQCALLGSPDGDVTELSSA
jgi:ribose 5-phosphate isomerase A